MNRLVNEKSNYVFRVFQHRAEFLKEHFEDSAIVSVQKMVELGAMKGTDIEFAKEGFSEIVSLETISDRDSDDKFLLWIKCVDDRDLDVYQYADNDWFTSDDEPLCDEILWHVKDRIDSDTWDEVMEYDEYNSSPWEFLCNFNELYEEMKAEED